MKRILLLANAFPYGNWEPYLTNEIPYLCESAEVSIFSLMLRKEQLAEKRELPSQVRVHKILFAPSIVYLLWAFRALFDLNLYREIRLLLRTGRFSLNRVKILFIFLSRVHYEKRKILRVLRKDPIYSPDDEVVIYAYRFAYQPYLASLIKNYFTGGKVKVIARAHGSDLYQSQAPGGYIPVRQVTLRAIDQVHLVSNFGYRYLLDSFPQFANKYYLSHLGVRRNQKRSISKDENQLRLVTCSTITPVKRLQLLVEALTLVNDFPIQWDHFGSGPLATEVETAAKGLPANIKVVFHGQVKNEQINDYFAAGKADFLINVSKSEGIPVSIMEALATGTPVLATNVGGNSEIVKDQVNGFLLESDPTREVLASRFKVLHQMSAEQYDQLSNGAYLSWESNWAQERNYRSFSKRLFS